MVLVYQLPRLFPLYQLLLAQSALLTLE